MIVKPKSQQALLRVQDFPEHVEANARLMATRQQLAELDRQFQDRLADRAAQHGRNTLEQAARAVLAGGEVPDAPVSGLVDTDFERLTRKKRVLTEAERIARQELGELEVQLSRQICAALKPQYAELVRNLDRALAALLEASEAERAFWARHAPNVPLLASLLPAATVAGIVGRSDEPWSRAAWWRREAQENGYLFETSEKEVA